MQFKNNLMDIMRDNVAVHCDTKEIAEALIKELVNQYVRWLTNGMLCNSLCTYDSNWEIFESETCYALQEGHEDLPMFGNRESFKKMGYKIIEFDGLLEQAKGANDSVKKTRC